MPRVVPTQVVNFIDQVFSSVINPAKGGTPEVRLYLETASELRALVDLVDRIPGELITLQGQEYAAFVLGVASIRQAIKSYEAERSYPLRATEALGGLHPIVILRQALAACPDQAAAAGTAELSFIQDQDLSEGLRRDISAVNRALTNGEWKAATVMAGSVVEALLLWTLQQSPVAARTNAVQRLVAKGTLRDPGSDLEGWALHTLIEVARELGVITDSAAHQARLARNFRNLIHPGRTLRLGETCDRGTALSAVAAVELVVRDLKDGP